MQNVFLIGLSGSGKSTIGRLLAGRLALPFFDTDEIIERECGKSISALFAQEGEDSFRVYESHVLRVLAASARRQEAAVIATGGGIVTRQENRLLMAERGIRVFLDIDLPTALQRLSDQHFAMRSRGETPEIRPLLTGPDPLATLHQLSTTRSAWYQEAEIHCLTSGKTPEQVVREILAALIGYGHWNGDAPIIRHIAAGNGYDAIVDWGGLGRLAHYLSQLKLSPRIFLITDSTVGSLYAPSLMRQLTQAGFEPQLYIIPAGEASKSQAQLAAIYDWLIEHHAERREAILAVGGGVVGDLAGYAAATYLRGVPLIQIPTSLLAQVDAAIGGKTGINHAKGKNLIGAFYHPRLVLADPATLLTLPVREYIEGWAEIVKYGIILDTELFALLEASVDILRALDSSPATLLSQIVARCIALKASVIEGDEREQGRRAILNYGHTVAHALENVAGYGELLHGEAVSIGMVVAAALAVETGMCAKEDAVRQNRLLAALGLPITYAGTVEPEAILAAMQLDKKVAGKRIQWVMPRQIGDVTVTPLPDDVVEHIITTFFAKKGP